MEVRFEPYGEIENATLVIHGDSVQIEHLINALRKAVAVDPSAVVVDVVGTIELGLGALDPEAWEELELSSKALKLLKLVEETPGLRRGTAMQKLAQRADDFDQTVYELQRHGLIWSTQISAKRGRPSTRYWSTRTHSPMDHQSELQLDLELEEASEPVPGLWDVEAESLIRDRLRPLVGSLADVLPSEVLAKIELKRAQLPLSTPIQAFKFPDGSWRVVMGEETIWEGTLENETSPGARPESTARSEPTAPRGRGAQSEEETK